MLVNATETRLRTISLPADFQAVQLRMVADDAAALNRTSFPRIIPTIYALAGGSNASVQEAFAAAWLTLIAAVRRLDHLEDGDEHPVWSPPTPHIGVQYNRLIGYMFVASSLLDDIDLCAVAPHRVQAVRRLWHDSLVRAASGQQRDLDAMAADQAIDARLDLDEYQQIAQAKSGALFRLAFGGAALLATDNEALCVALGNAGEVFGTLLQYSDDLRDAADQPTASVSLPILYNAAARMSGLNLPPHDIQGFWLRVYNAYGSYLKTVLTPCGPTIARGVRKLFADTFEQPSRADPINIATDS